MLPATRYGTVLNQVRWKELKKQWLSNVNIIKLKTLLERDYFEVPVSNFGLCTYHVRRIRIQKNIHCSHKSLQNVQVNITDFVKKLHTVCTTETDTETNENRPWARPSLLQLHQPAAHRPSLSCCSSALQHTPSTMFSRLARPQVSCLLGHCARNFSTTNAVSPARHKHDRKRFIELRIDLAVCRRRTSRAKPSGDYCVITVVVVVWCRFHGYTEGVR